MHALYVLLLAALVAGCSRTPIQIPSADQAARTWDGMVPIQGLSADEAWAKPDIDLSTYDQLLIAPTEFQFRAVRDPGLGGRRTATEFPISDENRRQLIGTVTEILREELAGTRNYTLTDSPGPGVLVVHTALLDIVSKVPPQEARREDIYLDEVGEATLVLELADSQSGERLARVVDRRAADPVGDLSRPSLTSRVSSVTAWSEVRRVARRWAESATRLLDQLHTRGRMPGR